MVRVEPAVGDRLTTSVGVAIDWLQAQQRLEVVDSYWLATSAPDGRPHVMPLLCVWVDDIPHVSMSARSRKSGNLTRDARCVLSTSDEVADFVIEGKAVRVRDGERLHRVATAYATKYGWHVEVRDCAFWAEGAPTAGPPPFDVYQIVPDKAFAFSKDASFDAMRWRFHEVDGS